MNLEPIMALNKVSEIKGNEALSQNNSKSNELQKNSQIEALNSKSDTLKMSGSVSHKAFFAVDENKNVIIRIVDSEGNIVKQIPPEEYVNMIDNMKELNRNLLHKEA
jgi:uncharacterized FlaG/YvyC family protein